MTALYIHIPFCRQKCPYCSFTSYADQDQLFSAYTDALIHELCLWGRMAGMPVAPLTSLFMGGGTPTVLPARFLVNILEKCFALFGMSTDAEISLEANPGTVDAAMLTDLVSCGVNRISFGVQSFKNSELNFLGRIHDSRAAMTAVEMAHAAGIENINIDLMYGIPEQTPSDWQKNMEIALSLRPQHLSMYQLTIEDGTPFSTWYADGRISLPAEEEILAMDAITKEMANRQGLYQYEISNWARPGRECQHNLVYWRNEEYIGVGAGAVSYWQGARKRRVASPRKYIEAMKDPSALIVEEENLDREASFRETVIMGLRLVQGVDLLRVQKRFGIDPREYYRDELLMLKDAGLISLTETHLALTVAGLSLANTVMAQLV